jgi:hypothetical protein
VEEVSVKGQSFQYELRLVLPLPSPLLLLSRQKEVKEAPDNDTQDCADYADYRSGHFSYPPNILRHHGRASRVGVSAGVCASEDPGGYRDGRRRPSRAVLGSLRGL